MSSSVPQPVLAVDRLVVRGLTVRGHHGVLEHERRDGQDFVIDVTLGIDSSVAAASDDLRDTVDYGSLAEEIRQAVADDPVDLIETLAQRLADLCLRHAPVLNVEVTVHKPHAPIQVPFEDVALTISRSRT
jgi:7,8-dihydroneopterin aldolase/epimerase/oxygenase